VAGGATSHWATQVVGGPTMLLRKDQPAAAAAAVPPEEAKRYAQQLSREIHPWADPQDVRTIVETQATNPALRRNRGLLRQAVCEELDRRRAELEQTYKKRRVDQQRAVEQSVRESAAERRAQTIKGQRSGGAREVYGRHEWRQRDRNHLEEQLRSTEQELRTLLERGAPEKPAGPEPRRLSRRGPWKTQMRAYEKHEEQVRGLEQRQHELQKMLNQIGMSQATFRQMVDGYLPPPPGAHAVFGRVPMIGGSKPYSADASYADMVYERGLEQAAREAERLRHRTREECEAGGQFPALALYCGLSAVPPLAHYHGATQSFGTLTLKDTRRVVEHAVSAHAPVPGRSQPQSAQAERNEMIAMTDLDGEDYLLYGRTQRLRLERQSRHEEMCQQVHAEKQRRHREVRLVDLENAAERLQSQPVARGCKAWRVQQKLKLKGAQLIVAGPSQAPEITAALRKDYHVIVWIPDDDPRPHRSHEMKVLWHLERDVLDTLYPQKNGKQRSEKTDGCRHRATLKRLMAKDTQSPPAALIIAASTPVTRVHYRAILALQADCKLAVIVCDPAEEQVQAAGLEAYTKSQGAKKRKSAGEKAAGRKRRK
jgi:hypothetical protein